MNVFTEYHHGGLLYSLKMLFEDRLGGKLCRPIGLDWFTSGYWKIAEPYGNSQQTIDQYLAIGGKEWDMYKRLNANYKLEDGVYRIFDGQYMNHHRAITLDTFKEMDIDYVIASIPTHIEPYKELVSKYHPKAKFIFQMGNMFQMDFGQIPNLLSSTIPFPVPSTCNAVFYHQEFDLNIFIYVPPTGKKKISSFIHCLPRKDMYDLYRNELKEFDFKAYGAGCPDGTFADMREIARTMQESDFGWHIKPGGDGFGHTIHNWFAVGRPVIVSGWDYMDKLAGALLVDGETCIDLDKHTFEENIRLIRYWSEPENHAKMCDNVYRKFQQVVDFDAEFIQIKQFLSNTL
jgi:hypothetical protein